MKKKSQCHSDSALMLNYWIEKTTVNVLLFLFLEHGLKLTVPQLFKKWLFIIFISAQA